MKTKACTGTCSEGRYSPHPGITSKSQCYDCPDGYHSNTQCLRDGRFEDKDNRRRLVEGEEAGPSRSRARDVTTLDELELEADELEAERLGERD